MSATEPIDFDVKVVPKAGFVDYTFIGNLLGEFLSQVRNQTGGAFEFTLTRNGKKAPSG